MHEPMAIYRGEIECELEILGFSLDLLDIMLRVLESKTYPITPYGNFRGNSSLYMVNLQGPSHSTQTSLIG